MVMNKPPLGVMPKDLHDEKCDPVFEREEMTMLQSDKTPFERAVGGRMRRHLTIIFVGSAIIAITAIPAFIRFIYLISMQMGNLMASAWNTYLNKE